MDYEMRELERPGDADADSTWREAAAAAGRPDGEEAPLPQEARRMVAFHDNTPVARLAFGARSGFTGAPGLTGYVGWYAATREGEAGVRLLRAAVDRLKAEGAARVVGPLDGSTWHRYRVTLPRESEIAGGEPFLSEPVNPHFWVDHFAAAGFRPLLEYETRLVRAPASAAQLAPKRAALAERGIRLRNLSPTSYESELHALYDVSVEAFAGNPFYTPISFAEFQRLYGPLRPLLDPALVRMAEDSEGRLVGYVFAFPDILDSAARPRIVLKTLAVRSEQRGSGLGAVLVDEVHTAAAERGAAVLHALMQVSNASRGISERSESELFRRYLLLSIPGA